MLPLILVMSFLAPAGGCANLSGKYIHAGEDGGTIVSIAQTQCERIVITWDSPMDTDSSTPRVPVPVRLVLDGRFHPTNRGSFGFPQMSASLNEATLTLMMTGQSPGDDAKPYTIRLTRLADGDLCVTDGTGSDPYSRYSRQHGPNRRAENDATRRSEQVCSVP